MTLLQLPPGAAYRLAFGIDDAGVIVAQANYVFADGSFNRVPVAWTAYGPERRGLTNTLPRISPLYLAHHKHCDQPRSPLMPVDCVSPHLLRASGLHRQ